MSEQGSPSGLPDLHGDVSHDASGRAFGAAGPEIAPETVTSELEALARQHFDAPFYRATVAACAAQALPGERLAEDVLTEEMLAQDLDAATHFLTHGWRLGLSPNRWFDTLGYLAANPEVAAMGINPFLHYLEVGLPEGRRAMPFFLDRTWHPAALHRFGRCEYGPIRHILRLNGPGLNDLDLHEPVDVEPPETLPETVPQRLAVHLHLFYPDMVGRCIRLLQRLPGNFDLLVSVREDADVAGLQRRLAQALPRARRVILRPGPNRGRDVAPWLVTFREEIRQSDLFLHLHSKKSAHGSYHAGWFDFLGHSLLGSDAVAAQMLDLFAADPGLGMVAPGYWPLLRRAPNYGKSRDLCAHLAARMGLPDLPAVCPDFPAGAFFCCRSSLLAPLLDLELTYRDFPAEAGQICGTLAHAVERLLGYLPQVAGLRFDMVAVDVPFEQADQQPVVCKPYPAGSLSAGQGGIAAAQQQRLPSVSVICTVTQEDGTRDGQSVGDTLAAALTQSHAPLEVLLVDVSGTDAALAQVTAGFGAEIAAGRLRLLALTAGDVAAARNAALEVAQGEVIAYLPGDTLWAPGYLAQVAAALTAHSDAGCLYSNLVQESASARSSARTSARTYDRAALVAGDGIDLAVFVHRRSLTDAGLRFAPGLGAATAWDFILQATAQQAPLHLEYAGCARTAPAQVSASPPPSSLVSSSQAALPAAARALMRRHRNERLYWGQEGLQIALKVPAPRPEFKHRWGDLHLAASLARALERLGCRTRVDILPDWYDHHPEDDVTLVLRGVTPYEPDPRHINLMWHISHPARVSLEEMRGFDHVFVSAYPEAEQVIDALGMQASAMLQCADPEVFHPQVDLRDVPRHDLLFVGNSRKAARWMPQACVERDLPVAVYGAEWEGLIPPQYLHGTHVPNDRLAAYYRASRIVLNDHWPDMADRGFVSNRIMDAGLSGALVISDHFRGEEIFMGHVVTCRTAAEVEDAVRYYLADEEARKEKAAALRQLVLLHHRVELRAQQVLQVARALTRDRLSRLR
ncbi:putative glycosyl hydrolase [Phaeobacter sp. CECT 5382]|uniref:rhamnan synthesis F family protein n=1 Tax=Phaeobacter sp. CECT 5382 TaxID=1712645 RepID=UPI0006DADDEE|nr:rhamnan synthesis F family protein [Phaeobacter sp. CECT 5382]CUH89370.1 putative glycosyl hydrolase [Phaeobacter sp. CECT 5382]